MNNKVYKEITAKMNKCISNKNAVIADYKQKLKDAETQFERASRFTVQNSDADTFIKAMSDKDTAEANINYFKTKLSLTESESIFTDAELDSFVKAIREEQTKLTDATFRLIAKNLNEVFTAYDDLYSQITDFNNLVMNMKHACNKRENVQYFDNEMYSFVRRNIGELERRVVTHPTFKEHFTNHNS